MKGVHDWNIPMECLDQTSKIEKLERELQEAQHKLDRYEKRYGKLLPERPAYDQNFGDDKICKCGHSYVRHFDPYEDYDPVGCKYCWNENACYVFEPMQEEFEL